MHNVVHLPRSVVDLGVGPIVEVQEGGKGGLQIGPELVAEHGLGAQQLGRVVGQEA